MRLRILALLIFLFTIPLVFLLPKIQIESSIDVFYDKTGQLYKSFSEWESQFGSDDRVIIAWKDNSLISIDGLLRVVNITSLLNSLDFVDDVQSLSTVSDIWGDGLDFYAQPLVSDEIEEGDLRKIRYRITRNPFFMDNLISHNLDAASIIVFLSRDKDNDRQGHIKKIIKKADSALKTKEHYLTGSAVIDYYYTKYMQDDLSLFLPLALILIFILLLFLFRGIAGSIFPFVLIIVNLIWTMSLLWIFGFSLDNITTIIPPIILAISIADAVHFMIRLRQELVRNQGINAAVISAVKDIFIPCLLTSLTTSVGFFSLTVSRIEPIRHLGIVAGIGVLLAFVFTFTFLPGMVLLVPYLLNSWLSSVSGDKGYRGVVDFVLDKIAVVVVRWNKVIILIFALILTVSLFFAMKVRPETIMINYFRKDTDVYKATKFIQDNFGGVQFLNLSLRLREGTFKEPLLLKRLSDFKQVLASRFNKIDKVISVDDYIKLMNRAMHSDRDDYFSIPSSESLINQYLLLYDVDDLKDYINDDWDWANVVIRSHENSSARLMKMAREIEAMAKKEFPECLVSVVGRSVLEAETNELVTRGQVKSIAIAVGVIFLMILFVFRSLKVGMISLIPNIFPLIINFGVMGMFGIYLDSATSIISAIGIGIIVDDTIHFLHSFLKHRRKGLATTNAVVSAIMDKGHAIIFTSVVLFVGFGVVSLSKFSPTADFGILSALLMLNALLADLFLLPAVLIALDF